MKFTGKAGLILATLAFGFLAQSSILAQDAMKQEPMKDDAMKQDSIKHDDMMMKEEKGKALLTGKFHGKVHSTEGRATVYQVGEGKMVLRLTGFKTSNGPDVHVILVAVKDAADDANFLTSKTDRVELGKLKGNQGDQNYEIPTGTDLSKFQAVSIYCERFNANFGIAALEKF